jgi:hypothetical protein
MICSFIRCLGEQTISYCEDKGPNITAGILWAIFILDMLGRGANGPNRTSRNARNINPTVSKRSRDLPWKTAPASHAPRGAVDPPTAGVPALRFPDSSFLLPPSLPPAAPAAPLLSTPLSPPSHPPIRIPARYIYLS